MISPDSDPSGNSILQDWYRASGKTPGFRRIRVFSLSITENHGKNHRQHTASGHELSTWSWIWFISFKKIFWETLWAIWFFLLRFVKWGYPQFWGHLRSGGTCAILSRSPSYVFRMKAKQKRRFVPFEDGSPKMWRCAQFWAKDFSDVSKTGQTPAANLTHPVSRQKIQPRNYDAGGTNPKMR